MGGESSEGGANFFDFLVAAVPIGVAALADDPVTVRRTGDKAISTTTLLIIGGGIAALVVVVLVFKK